MNEIEIKTEVERAAVEKALRDVRASDKHYPAHFPKPTVNRAVHYQSYGTPGGEYLPEARAATITAVNANPYTGEPNGDVSLCVMNPNGFFLNPNVPFSETPKPGHWSWPPRV